MHRVGCSLSEPSDSYGTTLAGGSVMGLEVAVVQSS